MNSKNHEYFMQKAVDIAWRFQLLTYPNPAVGAVVVKDNIILSCAAHKTAGGPHAEVLALKEAYLTKYPDSELTNLIDSFEIHNFLYKNHNDFFKECTIYVTLEPCNHTGKTPACALLLKSVEIKEVFIGSLDPNDEAAGGVKTLKDANIKVTSGILKEQTDKLLEPFTLWQKGNFTFFKIAMREDGSVDGGYITSQDSLNLVHEIRTKLDLLVIGGQTVRLDRPTLDSRFALENKPTDILIYSNQDQNSFDKAIPLFNIPNRDVKISDNLDEIKNNKFIMIEGGYNLLDKLKDICDYIVVFVSHKEKFKDKVDFKKLKLKKIYSYFINQTDEIIYLKHIIN